MGLELIIISSLFSLALYNFSQEDEPLHFFRRFMDRVGSRIAKDNDSWNEVIRNHDGDIVGYVVQRKLFYPVLYCSICMGWFYFTLVFAAYNTFYDCWQWVDILQWIVSAPATSFLNWYLQETLAKALN